MLFPLLEVGAFLRWALQRTAILGAMSFSTVFVASALVAGALVSSVGSALFAYRLLSE